MKGLHMIAFLLIIIGALNWGLIGIGGESWNIVAKLGSVDQWIYILVGLAAVFELVTHKKGCSACGSCRVKSAPASE